MASWLGINVVHLLAELTVMSSPGVDCPDEKTLATRLEASGIAVRNADSVRVSFARDGEMRVAEIVVPGAEPRRIEHRGPDCMSLADATVALLGVLLEEVEESPPPPRPEESLTRERPPGVKLRGDAGALVAGGVVADVSIGATIGLALRPTRWLSLGVAGELWPRRDHVAEQGSVFVTAWSAGLVGCAGPHFDAFALEGCLFGHGGVYALSAGGFPVVRPTERALFGVEPAIRASYAVTPGFGVFARAGVWVPFTRFDVAARGMDTAFSTTSVAPKAALGIELNP